MILLAKTVSGHGKTNLITPGRLFASGDLNIQAAEVAARGRGDFADRHLSYDGLGRDEVVDKLGVGPAGGAAMEPPGRDLLLSRVGPIPGDFSRGWVDDAKICPPGSQGRGDEG